MCVGNRAGVSGSLGTEPPFRPGQDFLRASQMNLSMAAWGRLVMNLLPPCSSPSTISPPKGCPQTLATPQGATDPASPR